MKIDDLAIELYENQTKKYLGPEFEIHLRIYISGMVTGLISVKQSRRDEDVNNSSRTHLITQDKSQT